jgi:beta-mannanase
VGRVTQRREVVLAVKLIVTAVASAVGVIAGSVAPILSSAPANASSIVTFDALGGNRVANATSLSWTQNVGTGTDRAILAEATVGAANDNNCSQVVKMNGVLMTKLAVIHTDNQHSGYMDIWGATNPSPGTNTFSLAVSGCASGTPSSLTATSLSFANVSQSAAFSSVTSAVGSGTTPSATVPSEAGNLMAGFVADGKGLLSATSPAVSRVIENDDWNTGAGNSAAATSAATGTNVTMAWTGDSDYWGVGTVQVLSDNSNPASTVTVTNPGNQTSTVGTAVSLQTSATDSQPGQTLTFTATGLPQGLSISSSGLISGTPVTAGTSNALVTAQDNKGASGSAAFNWTVSTGTAPLNSKTLCVYEHGLAALQSYETALGKTVHCVEVFADSDACWTVSSASPCNPYNSWVDPWFDSGTPPDADWKDWLASDPSNRIVISHEIVPQDVSSDMGDGKYDPNWRQDCASGAFSSYYPTLAQNLINAGFGHAVIRLGHEMNGDWYSDSLGSDPAQYSAWAQCFAKVVTGMRSVPGANFLFDWNVNQGYRDIPFSSYYPGNAYVDIIGMDAYDSGMPGNPQTQPTRWNAEYTEGGGLASLVSFASSNGKPISLPEWGLADTADGGIGDDPYYVQQMVNLIGSTSIVYQSYFDPGTSGIPTIESEPNSWPIYKNAFGPNGNLQGTPW